jgi:hypothetical protein
MSRLVGRPCQFTSSKFPVESLGKADIFSRFPAVAQDRSQAECFKLRMRLRNAIFFRQIL